MHAPELWAIGTYVAATAAAIVWLAWRYSLAVETTRWPYVEGKLINAWVDEVWNDGREYVPRVEYIYKVNGLIYTSFAISVRGDTGGSKWSAERVVSYYLSRPRLLVWYDPAKPSRAVLKPGGARWYLVALVAVTLAGPLLAFTATPVGRQLLGALAAYMSD